MRVDCAVVRHHDDGSTTVTAWTIGEDQERKVAAVLGEPQMHQVFGPGAAATLDAVANLGVTVER